MIECHGWITIRESYNEDDESEEKLAQAINIISSATDEIQNMNLVASLTPQNGIYNLLVNGNFNHADSRWKDVLELYQLVANVAVGSYGLLHFYDDEAGEGKNNTFQVYVLARGIIELSIEKHLSPYIPTLEDLP